MNLTKGSLTIFVLFLFSPNCSSTGTITPNKPIKDGDVLISSGQKFTLGFFSPGNSTRRYVGIWYYNLPEQTVVWVANRDSPINDKSGVLSINSQGNLVLYGQNGTFPVWSANISATTSISFPSTAQLLDSGNLVLIHQDSQTMLWQSFDYATDTMLPTMKLGMNKKSGLYWYLTSWKSKNDPGTGNVSLRFDPTGYPQMFLYEGQVQRWRGGPWNGNRLSGIPEMAGKYFFRVGFVDNEDEFYMYNNMTNLSVISRLIVDESGSVQRFAWSGENHQWIEFYSDPNEQCDYYGVCGPNGNCDPYETDTFMCKCLPGFEPKSPSDWNLRDGSEGCIRNAGVSTCQSGEGFVKLERVKVPDTSTARVNMSMSLKACEEECLRNCSCNAYTTADVVRGFGCLSWYGDLLDIRTFSDVGQDIYIRVDAAELAIYGKSKGPLANDGTRAAVIVSVAVALFLIVFLIFWFVRKKRKGSTRLSNSPSRTPRDERGSSDPPFIDLSAIVAATNNFSVANKLGEGGFGSVYKGMLYGGKEIAVKRLSSNSGQGIDEFRNEVALIAKLQHRNLVRILGYCIQDQEKMLIYEYLPNKSLDSIIFDEKKSSELDWPRRYIIICGIARGILYLHQDSRLRIIHRDLKASNVLLDASMNPKISDFGMARIFGADQIQANTKRIVGTYGYMSPEYAMHGIFSVKSDVYSFGVLLIEIISGKKNSNFYDESSSSNLVGYVWDLWKEGRAVEIVDASVGDSYPSKEVLRCIQIGLLCVQESAMDRPTMSAVVFMLNNDTALLPPRQPAFILKKTGDGGDPSTSERATSLNDVTITLLNAR